MKNILYVLISSYGSMLLGLIVSLYTKQRLGPSFAGALAFVAVFMYYADAINSLFRSAMDREVPMARGIQDNELERKLAGHIYWGVLVVNIFFSMFFIFETIYYWDDIELRYAFLIGICLSNITSISNYLQVYHRVYEQFKTSSIYVMSIQTVLQIASLVGVFFGNVIGYVYACIFSFLVTIIIVRKKLFSVMWINLDKTIIKIILKSGVLLSVYSFVQLGLFTIDRFFILHFLTRIQLGNYAIALTISSVISILPASFSSSILMPKWYKWSAANEWEKANSSIIASSFVALHITGMVILISAVYIIPFFINTFLSKFVLSIDAAKVLSVSAYWLFMIGPFSVLLSSKEKYWQMIFCGVIGILIAVTVNYFMIYMGIVGVAISTTIALFIFANLMFFISQFTITDNKNEIVQNFVLLNSFGIILYLIIVNNLFSSGYLLYLVYLFIQKKKIKNIFMQYLSDLGMQNYKSYLYTFKKSLKARGWL